MCSSIHLLAFSGDIFQPDAQVDTISTSDAPFFAMEFSNACRMAFFAFFTAVFAYIMSGGGAGYKPQVYGNSQG